MAEVYKACSGGEGMNCGSCACDLKKMVDDHNSKIAVHTLSEQINEVVQKTKETV
jgi:bacterioferritin-associated ferredoxin